MNETPSGRQLAEAFEELIENTTYFRSWRDSNEVPRWILEEYGRAACVCEMADARDGGFSGELCCSRTRQSPMRPSGKYTSHGPERLR